MTRSSTARALQPLDPNVEHNKPATPGKQVRHLKTELEKKDVENEQLRKNIIDLNKALSGLTLAKDIVLENTDNLKATAASSGGKKTKDEDAPIPPKTAYRYFSNATPKQEGVDMRQLWKECDTAVKQKFTSMAAYDKARYNDEMATYKEETVALEMYYEKKKEDTAMQFYEAHVAAKAALDNVDSNKKVKKASKKDPDAPKRPISSYFYFAADNRDTAKKSNPDATVTDISKILGEMWKKLEKGKKGKKGTKKYDDLAANDQIRYAAEKATYDSMIAKRNAESEIEKKNTLKKDKEEAMKLMGMFKNASNIVTSEVGSTIGIMDEMSVASETTAAASITKNEKKVKKKKDPNAPKKNLSAYIFFCTCNRSKIVLPADAKQTEILTELGRQWKALGAEDKQQYIDMATKDKERYTEAMEVYSIGKTP